MLMMQTCLSDAKHRVDNIDPHCTLCSLCCCLLASVSESLPRNAKRATGRRIPAAWLQAVLISYRLSSSVPVASFHPRICAIFLSGTPRARSPAATLFRILAGVTAPGIPAFAPARFTSFQTPWREIGSPSRFRNSCGRERCPVRHRCRRGALPLSPRKRARNAPPPPLDRSE